MPMNEAQRADFFRSLGLNLSSDNREQLQRVADMMERDRQSGKIDQNTRDVLMRALEGRATDDPEWTSVGATSESRPFWNSPVMTGVKSAASSALFGLPELAANAAGVEYFGKTEREDNPGSAFIGDLAGGLVGLGKYKAIGALAKGARMAGNASKWARAGEALGKSKALQAGVTAADQALLGYGRTNTDLAEQAAAIDPQERTRLDPGKARLANTLSNAAFGALVPFDPTGRLGKVAVHMAAPGAIENARTQYITGNDDEAMWAAIRQAGVGGLLGIGLPKYMDRRAKKIATQKAILDREAKAAELAKAAATTSAETKAATATPAEATVAVGVRPPGRVPRGEATRDDYAHAYELDANPISGKMVAEFKRNGAIQGLEEEAKMFTNVREGEDHRSRYMVRDVTTGQNGSLAAPNFHNTLGMFIRDATGRERGIRLKPGVAEIAFPHPVSGDPVRIDEKLWGHKANTFTEPKTVEVEGEVPFTVFGWKPTEKGEFYVLKHDEPAARWITLGDGVLTESQESGLAGQQLLKKVSDPDELAKLKAGEGMTELRPAKGRTAEQLEIDTTERRISLVNRLTETMRTGQLDTNGMSAEDATTLIKAASEIAADAQRSGRRNYNARDLANAIDRNSAGPIKRGRPPGGPSGSAETLPVTKGRPTPGAGGAAATPEPAPAGSAATPLESTVKFVELPNTKEQAITTPSGVVIRKTGDGRYFVTTKEGQDIFFKGNELNKARASAEEQGPLMLRTMQDYADLSKTSTPVAAATAASEATATPSSAPGSQEDMTERIIRVAPHIWVTKDKEKGWGVMALLGKTGVKNKSFGSEAAAIQWARDVKLSGEAPPPDRVLPTPPPGVKFEDLPDDVPSTPPPSSPSAPQDRLPIAKGRAAAKAAVQEGDNIEDTQKERYAAATETIKREEAEAAAYRAALTSEQFGILDQLGMSREQVMQMRPADIQRALDVDWPRVKAYREEGQRARKTSQGTPAPETTPAGTLPVAKGRAAARAAVQAPEASPEGPPPGSPSGRPNAQLGKLKKDITRFSEDTLSDLIAANKFSAEGLPEEDLIIAARAIIGKMPKEWVALDPGRSSLNKIVVDGIREFLRNNGLYRPTAAKKP